MLAGQGIEKRAKTAVDTRSPVTCARSSNTFWTSQRSHSGGIMTMATQNEDGIPLSLLSKDQQQTFRLLELPPELLTLLTSENPPV